MDNLSGETKEKKSDLQLSAKDSSKDIRFEEVVNVDEIQKALKLKIDNEESNIEFAPKIKKLTHPTKVKNENANKNDKSQNEAPIRPDIDYNSKKYVIYVDSDNIEFMESLPGDEKRKIINEILREQGEVGRKNKLKKERQKYFKHALVVTFTFIIGFPLMFYCVNFAIEGSMDNYQQARANFIKLYKEQGKIKQADIRKELAK